MKKEAQRLKALALAGRLPEVQTPDSRMSEIRSSGIPDEPHAAHGDKGEYVKVTATLSPEVYKLLAGEAQRRKLAKEPNAQLSAVMREAVLAYFKRRTAG